MRNVSKYHDAFVAGLSAAPAPPPDRTSPSAPPRNRLDRPALYGQAGAKSVEMAFKDLNGFSRRRRRLQSRHGHTRQPESGQRRRRPGDAARQHQQEGAGHHRRHHLVGVDPDSDRSWRCRRRADVARLVLADAGLTLGRDGKTNGVFFRTITRTHCKGTQPPNTPSTRARRRSPSSTSTTTSA